ncbi:Solute carrier family 35 member F2 [Thelohanellus kitauei]|uniref:Solute carrier family 35 member F2 n=1 Tax=Thelohanellus kitauei TaxID=669202 RepID=A0A0C2JJU0_THEKT|nr:Solute carrier family 35 member F2 [Thelohanellus kitauei]
MIKEEENSGRISNLTKKTVKFFTSRVFCYSLLSQVAALGLFGLGVAVDNAGTSKFPSLPSFMAFCVHFTLTLIFLPYFVYHNSFKEVIKRNWWRYLLTSFCEVQGTYLIELSYNYANYIVVQFLDYSCIVFAFIFSLIILKKKFYLFHFVGAAITVGGIVMLTLYDINGDYSVFSERNDKYFKYFGESMSLVGCLMYALSTVLSEKFLADASSFEWLTFQGLFSMGIALIQGIILELIWPNEIKITFSTTMWVLLYVVCSVSFYSICPFVFLALGAARSNLFYTSADIMAVIYSSHHKQRMTVIFGVSLLLAVLGNTMFSIQTMYQEERMKKRTHAPTETSI